MEVTIDTNLYQTQNNSFKNSQTQINIVRTIVMLDEIQITTKKCLKSDFIFRSIIDEFIDQWKIDLKILLQFIHVSKSISFIQTWFIDYQSILFISNSFRIYEWYAHGHYDGNDSVSSSILWLNIFFLQFAYYTLKIED